MTAPSTSTSGERPRAVTLSFSILTRLPAAFGPDGRHARTRGTPARTIPRPGKLA
ncbi:hypothetical protein [Streptomyces sp. NPDC005244]|uniref:hypothetical protein n=1 Tax=Streptomyces sp. NPDC005244 TaxID=3364708 RepID=UPI00367946DC